MSALFGIHVDAGTIDIKANLSSLGIDEDDPLSETEKSARIIDLLRSRSGVFRPAAYTSYKKVLIRPNRGEYKPGEYWYYNNWDFNVLATIFHRLTGSNVFQAFNRDIARPIGMQDFLVSDGHFIKNTYLDTPHIHFRGARYGTIWITVCPWG